MIKLKLALQILKNDRGVAILLMTTAIIFLTAILADFTFETTVNKTKVYNVQDKAKAKLNAESGLKFAMARLRIYKEARNQLSTNNTVSGAVGPEALNTIWSFPVSYTHLTLPTIYSV